MKKQKTVAYIRFPDNSFISTCRDVSAIWTWEENDQYMWYSKYPEIKFNIVFKGDADEAEKVRIVFDASLKSVGCEQRPMARFEFDPYLNQ